jgi:transposase
MEPMRKSRLSCYKQDRLIEHFISGSTALTAASLCGVNLKTAAFFFLRLREIIVLELEAESEAMFGGEIEVDESYFGGKWKGKRGRGAGGKIPVFGLLKRGGRVYTKIISDASRATLIPIIERKVVPDSIVYSDCWKAYNVLDVSDFKHFRINHSVLFADTHNHTNGIENFWNQAKRHMRKFNGVPKAQFGLYLKECEWRFNNSDLSDQLLRIRQWVKRYLRWLSGSAPKIIIFVVLDPKW